MEFGGGSTNRNIGDISKIAYFVLYVNTALDPLLYNGFNSNFKIECNKLFKRWSTKRSLDRSSRLARLSLRHCDVKSDSSASLRHVGRTPYTLKVDEKCVDL